MKTSIVIGLGFGDEGKGLTTDYLCRQAAHPLVVRFNGGHQAGHTVVTDEGKRHVFSSLGSGTLRGVPTYWSSYCTFYPPGFLAEHKALVEKGMRPQFYLDAGSPVTTFYDVLFNRALERSRDPHGSCGLGFGVTIERTEAAVPLYAQDLFDTGALRTRLEAVAAYYDQKIKAANNALLAAYYYDYDFAAIREQFIDTVQACTAVVELVEERAFFDRVKERGDVAVIFEGAQGILLDMDYGFFPHVTRSHTSSRNALELVRRNGLPQPAVYYISRTYQTRHGAGPMTNEGLRPELGGNDKETNVFNEWQGNFRTAVLDVDLLRYALECDDKWSVGLSKNLVLTCLDQTGETIPVTVDGEAACYTAEELAALLLPGYHHLMLSASPCSRNIRTVKGTRCGEKNPAPAYQP
jgi:adenylosuccinate synthase